MKVVYVTLKAYIKVSEWLNDRSRTPVDPGHLASLLELGGQLVEPAFGTTRIRVGLDPIIIKHLSGLCSHAVNELPYHEQLHAQYALVFKMCLAYAHHNPKMLSLATTQKHGSRVVLRSSLPRPNERRVPLESLFPILPTPKERSAPQGGTHATPIRHSVVEHLRQLKNGKIVVVRGHERGTGTRPDTITLV